MSTGVALGNIASRVLGLVRDIVLAAPLGPFTEPFERTARRGTLALIAIALVAFTLATLVTGRLTRSLGQLADAADAVSAGHLERKVEETGGDETRRVARAFNTMVTSLRETLMRLTQKESLAAVGEFATSLAHEVRNPLTSVRLILPPNLAAAAPRDAIALRVEIDIRGRGHLLGSHVRRRAKGDSRCGEVLRPRS